MGRFRGKLVGKNAILFCIFIGVPKCFLLFNTVFETFKNPEDNPPLQQVITKIFARILINVVILFLSILSHIIKYLKETSRINYLYFQIIRSYSYIHLYFHFSEERKWRKWADSVLVHTLSPNVYRTTEEALQSFNWFSEVGEWEANFPAWERYLMIYVGASAMWLIGKRLKKRHNLKDDVRQSLYDECNHWLRAVKSKGGQFMGGQTPNLADLAVYGVLSSIEGCLAFKDLLNNTKIGPWYFGMKKCISEHEGAKSI